MTSPLQIPTHNESSLPAPSDAGDLIDIDPQETAEWQASLSALLAAHGPQRARFLLQTLAQQARTLRIGWTSDFSTPYVNTIAVNEQPSFGGDLAIEERLASLMRWNALAMVARANQAYGDLGGHIASYAWVFRSIVTGHSGLS